MNDLPDWNSLTHDERQRIIAEVDCWIDGGWSEAAQIAISTYGAIRMMLRAKSAASDLVKPNP